MLGGGMKRLVIALALVASAGLVTLAAQRILTNAAEPYLKRLFPQAVAFWPFGGPPPPHTADGVNPKTNPQAPPIGLVFWTTDLVPEEHGYHGAIHIIVGLD